MGLIKLNNRGVRAATNFGGTTSLGSWVFIKKVTASSDSTISFVDGTSDVVLDDTYKEYVFTFNNMHPSADSDFSFNMSVDTGSNYNVAKTSSCHLAYHGEGDTPVGAGYNTTHDLAQGTGFQNIAANTTASNNDGSCSGYLHIFDPSNTTFVKHYIAESIRMDQTVANHFFIAGYGNTTSAVDAIQFKNDTGNMDSGDICLYGIS